MKYKITNKIEANVNFQGVLFRPKETKILELDKKPEHEYFNIEELGKDEKKNKYKEEKIENDTE